MDPRIDNDLDLTGRWTHTNTYEKRSSMNSLDEYRSVLPQHISPQQIYIAAFYHLSSLSAFINFENRVTGIEILPFHST